MLLKSLHIKSYRGIEDLALSNLSPVSLIVGANNSGKSSILEAVALLLRPLAPPQWIRVGLQRDTDANFADALWSMFPSKGVLNLDNGPQQAEAMKVEGQLPDGRRVMEVEAKASEDEEVEESGVAKVHIGVTIGDNLQHDLIFRPGKRAEWGEGVTLHPDALGILLDADLKNPTKRFEAYRDELNGFDFFPHLGHLKRVEEVANPEGDDRRAGVFVFPDSATAGMIEDILLPLGEAAFPKLHDTSKKFVESWDEEHGQEKLFSSCSRILSLLISAFIVWGTPKAGLGGEVEPF